MNFEFKILSHQDSDSAAELLFKLNDGKISKPILKERFLEMLTQNYEGIGIFKEETMIGVCGLWYCTRHYSGRSVEIDHVFIEEIYRKEGLGKQLMHLIESHVALRNTETLELNTYVQNGKSHKFYYNQGFTILGFHFLKKL